MSAVPESLPIAPHRIAMHAADNVAIVAGQTVTVTGFTLTDGNA